MRKTHIMFSYGNCKRARETKGKLPEGEGKRKLALSPCIDPFEQRSCHCAVLPCFVLGAQTQRSQSIPRNLRLQTGPRDAHHVPRGSPNETDPQAPQGAGSRVTFFDIMKTLDPLPSELLTFSGSLSHCFIYSLCSC